MSVPASFPDTLPTPIAFVGEAPSDEEVWRGKPFVGPAGKVLDQMLRAADLDRDLYLVTNLFDEKAPDNDVSDWLRDQGRVHAARERLAGELLRAAPNVVVPLGGTALWGLTGVPGISSYRGTVSKARFVIPGVKIVPTFHPAAVMRDWKLMAPAVGDLIRAGRESEFPEVRYPKVELLVEPTVDEALAFMEECKGSDLLSVDIETGWGQITCIGFAPTPERAMCVPFVDTRRPNSSYWRTVEEELHVWKGVRDLLAHPVPKVGQNFTYDAAWLYKKAGIVVNNYLHDTRLMHHAKYAELPKSLEFMGASYTDLGPWKDWGGHKKGKRDE